MTSLARFFMFCAFLAPICGYANEAALKTMVRTTYPSGIAASTKGHLLAYILEGTGYKVYLGRNAPPDARSITSQTLSYQRSGMLMTRVDAMLMAIGEQNSLVIDHDNKLISVTRDPLYDK